MYQGTVEEGVGKFQQVAALHAHPICLDYVVDPIWFIHPFQDVIHSTSEADTLTSDWLA